MKVEITKVARYTTNKTGEPLVNKQGRPYTSIRIQTKEHGEKWVSGFGNKENASWKEGDSVEIDITPNGEYLNFSMPKRIDNEQLEKIFQNTEFILNRLTGIKLLLETQNGVEPVKAKDYPVNDVPEPFPESDLLEGITF